MSINTVNNNIWFVGNITDSNVHYIIQELEKLVAQLLAEKVGV